MPMANLVIVLLDLKLPLAVMKIILETGMTTARAGTFLTVILFPKLLTLMMVYSSLKMLTSLRYFQASQLVSLMMAGLITGKKLFLMMEHGKSSSLQYLLMTIMHSLKFSSTIKSYTQLAANT